jgi:hypothetical protein
MSSIYQSFLPTYLYIKQHQITGKLYFGKTVKNPEEYKGSGKHWTLHRRKHGNKIDTVWYCLYLDEESIKEAALSFSKLWNIIESDQWLNLIEEDGIGNGLPIGHKKTEEHKRKISESNKGKMPWLKGKNHSEETKKKLSKTKLAKNKKYSDQEKKNVSEGTKRAMNNPIVKAKCAAPHIKNWVVTDPDGNDHHITNLSQYCRDNGLITSTMKTASRTGYKTSGGYRVRLQHI